MKLENKKNIPLIHPQLSECLQQVMPAAEAKLSPLPLSPGLSLYLINEDFPHQQLNQQEMLAIMKYPAYWAFCWASGQVLAQFIQENPVYVKDKRVLDFGCGSGVVAIAASQAGASQVVACDIDNDALLATQANAVVNQVEILLSSNYYDVTGPVDIIIVADVLYDRENLLWLNRFLQRAKQVLVADSRVKDFNYPSYRLIDRRQGTTVPDLDEFDEFRDVRIYYADHPT